MMNEIEKLYKNAGLSNMWVEEYDDMQFWHGCYIEMIQSMMKLNDWDRKTATSVAHKECRKAHPSFTSEKQLELIKFLFNHNVYYDVDEKGNYWFHISDEIENSKYREFDEATAECINKMWQDLTEEEKEQIREILE